MPPRNIYLFSFLSLAIGLQGADKPHGSRVVDGEEKESTFIEKKQNLFKACESCDAVRAIQQLALIQAGEFSPDEQRELTNTTINQCGTSTTGSEIIDQFAAKGFDFNRFKGLPALFVASVSASQSCNLSLVKALLKGGADPSLKFSYNHATANTYILFEALAKQNDCGPCTRDVFRLFPKSSGADFDMQREAEQPAPETEYVPVPVPMPMPSDMQGFEQFEQYGSSQSSQGEQSDSGSSEGQGSSSQGQGQGGGSGDGSGVADWGSWASDLWKNL